MAETGPLDTGCAASDRGWRVLEMSIGVIGTVLGFLTVAYSVFADAYTFVYAIIGFMMIYCGVWLGYDSLWRAKNAVSPPVTYIDENGYLRMNENYGKKG